MYRPIKQMTFRRTIKARSLNDKVAMVLLNEPFSEWDIINLKAGKTGVTQIIRLAIQSPVRVLIHINNMFVATLEKNSELTLNQVVMFLSGEFCHLCVEVESRPGNKDMEYTLALHYLGELEVVD